MRFTEAVSQKQAVSAQFGVDFGHFRSELGGKPPLCLLRPGFAGP